MCHISLIFYFFYFNAIFHFCGPLKHSDLAPEEVTIDLHGHTIKLI